MSNVPKSNRNETGLEAEHHFYHLRKEVTDLMLLDFGFSVEKYEKMISRYRETHATAENVDAVVARMRAKCEAFYKWFIDKECDAILQMLREIQTNFTMANSIYPSETPAKIPEFCERRKYMDAAIAWCFALKQEIQYVIMALPVDINKYQRFDDMINLQISLYKGLRRSDNRLLKPQKRNKNKTKGKAVKA